MPTHVLTHSVAELSLGDTQPITDLTLAELGERILCLAFNESGWFRIKFSPCILDADVPLVTDPQASATVCIPCLTMAVYRKSVSPVSLTGRLI